MEVLEGKYYKIKEFATIPLKPWFVKGKIKFCSSILGEMENCPVLYIGNLAGA
jgi:hypothetical protein